MAEQSGFKKKVHFGGTLPATPEPAAGWLLSLCSCGDWHPGAGGPARSPWRRRLAVQAAAACAGCLTIAVSLLHLRRLLFA